MGWWHGNASDPISEVTVCRAWLVQRWVTACPPTDSIMRLITVWWITGKIIRTTIMLVTYAHV